MPWPNTGTHLLALEAASMAVLAYWALLLRLLAPNSGLLPREVGIVQKVLAGAEGLAPVDLSNSCALECSRCHVSYPIAFFQASSVSSIIFNKALVDTVRSAL